MSSRRAFDALVVTVALILVLVIVFSSDAQDSPASTSRKLDIPTAISIAPDGHQQALRNIDRQLRHAAWLDSVDKHRQWLADQEAARKAAAAKAAQQAQQASSGSPMTDGAVGTPGGGSSFSGSIPDLIRSIFGRIAPGFTNVALCIANRESGFNPSAKNPSSSASGLFQFLDSVWATLSQRYGFGGASPFSAVANATVAAYTMRDLGLSPWGGGC